MSRAHDLSARQEAFAKGVARGLSKSDAYREAFTPRAGAGSKSIHECASRVASVGKVRARISELRALTLIEANVAHGVTTDSLLREADDAFRLAAAQENAKAMVAATRLKAALTGLLVAERDNAREPLTHISDAGIRAELSRLRSERESTAPK